MRRNNAFQRISSGLDILRFYAAGTLTRRAISTATSGIDYKSNGSISWSNDKFRAGIKSGAVNGAISYGLSSFNVGGSGAFGNGLRAGITSFANSTLDFSEDGWKIGIRNDNNWGDRFASGRNRQEIMPAMFSREISSGSMQARMKTK